MAAENRNVSLPGQCFNLINQYGAIASNLPALNLTPARTRSTTPGGRGRARERRMGRAQQGTPGILHSDWRSNAMGKARDSTYWTEKSKLMGLHFRLGQALMWVT